MIAVKATDMRDNFKAYCDKIAKEKEIVFVTRKGNENVVMLSEDEYNVLLKAQRNTTYLAKLDKSMEEIKEGKIVVKTMEVLEAMAQDD